MDNDDKPEDASGLPAVVDTAVVPASARAFTLIPGDGPAPAAHLFRHPDGFVCLNLSSQGPSRAVLRLVDSSYDLESETPKATTTDELGGDFRF